MFTAWRLSSLSYHSSCMLSPSGHCQHHLEVDEIGDDNGFIVLSCLYRKGVRVYFFLYSDEKILDFAILDQKSIIHHYCNNYRYHHHDCNCVVRGGRPR